MRLLTCRRQLSALFAPACLARWHLGGVYIVTAAGVPLPAGHAAHKSGELYPCSDFGSVRLCVGGTVLAVVLLPLAGRANGLGAGSRGRPPEYAIAEARRAESIWPGSSSRRARERIAVLCSAGDGRLAEVLSGEKACSGHEHDGQPSDSKSNRVIGWKASIAKGIRQIGWRLSDFGFNEL